MRKKLTPYYNGCMGRRTTIGERKAFCRGTKAEAYRRTAYRDIRCADLSEPLKRVNQRLGLSPIYPLATDRTLDTYFANAT